MAIIVSKDSERKPTFKSVTFPPTDEELERAKALDRLLSRRIPEVEKKLISQGLLQKKVPTKNAPAKGGNVKLWYQLGLYLQLIADNPRLVKPAEQRWLWEAIRMYATPRILRKDRGSSRVHLDYCYRVSKLPWDCIERFHWDDWVYLLDSRSFRGEVRADRWIQSRVHKLNLLSREQLRQMVQSLNATFKNKETSVLNDTELFAKYDAALEAVLGGALNSTDQIRPKKGSSGRTTVA